MEANQQKTTIYFLLQTQELISAYLYAEWAQIAQLL